MRLLERFLVHVERFLIGLGPTGLGFVAGVAATGASGWTRKAVFLGFLAIAYCFGTLIRETWKW